MARITGMSHENLREELYQGAKFVTFEYCISLIIISLKFNSSTYFIIQGERTAGKSFGYSLISLLFGWWGIPWGPVYTIKSLINNFSGGKDVTAEFSALLEESDQGKEELVQKL
ncbi:MAG: hypothetical protein GY754_23650 [bacterium]|nr:hypothetical protein [bacterium]